MGLSDSVSSIVRKYNQAADWEKPAVVKVLSQLNGVSQAKIRSVLKANGCDMTYAQKAAKRPPKRAPKAVQAKPAKAQTAAKAPAYTKAQMMARIREIPLSQVLADRGITLREDGQFKVPLREDLTCLRLFPDDRGWKDVRSDFQPKRDGRAPEPGVKPPADDKWDPSPVKLGGNVIALVQRLDGLDPQEAVQSLLDRYEPKMGRALREAHSRSDGTYSLDDIYKAAREIPVTRLCEDQGIRLRPEGQTFKPAIKGMNSGLRVWPGTGGWHDFKENAGGGPIEFMEHFRGMDKQTALKELVSNYLPQMLPDLERITQAAEKPSQLTAEETGITYRGKMNAEQRQSFSETIRQIHADREAKGKQDLGRSAAVASRGYAR